MTNLAFNTTLSAFDPPRTTGAAVDEGLLGVEEEVAPESGWMDCVETIRGWLRDVPDWEEDGIEVPTRSTMRRAIGAALALRAKGWANPTRTIPNGEGGIVFELRGDGVYEALTITDAELAELDQFVGSRLVNSIRVPFTRLL